jgi:hypothetical protein
MQANKGRRNDSLEPAHKMPLRHTVLEPELIEQRALIRRLPSYHRRSPANVLSAGISVAHAIKQVFQRQRSRAAERLIDMTGIVQVSRTPA